MMEEELRAVLKADPAVMALANFVEWGAAPRGATLPGLVLNVISDLDDYGLEGATGRRSARIQVDAYADSYGAAKRLGRSVRARLSGYAGGRLDGVFLAGSRDGREGGTNEAVRPYRCSLDFNVEFHT